MSAPYDEPMFVCQFCGEQFTADDIINDDGQHYCRECFDYLKEKGEI
ncbi:hypothetical protein M0R04_11760 [Candidatus Dojkabacteria bacterium]|jgi:formylmethanofuran dehydrogenase subunit E|nr:hypothetical protein [Candidatus Dojkabacteria bacterium]